MLFNAALNLKIITKLSNFDKNIFELMDKVCQMMYAKNKEIK